MLKALMLSACLLAGAVQAAPPRELGVTYDLYRNSHKLGQVVDHFIREGDRYTLTSETRATGPLKMLWPGVIRLESRGSMTASGLRPEQFQHARSDAPHKLATARLDWAQRRIEYRYRERNWTVDGLHDGAQDQLSQLYQFMFTPRLPAEFALQVVSGRDMHDYRYAQSDGGTLVTPLGRLRARQFQRIGQRPDEKAITVWIAPARDNLPVQVRVVEDGVVLEQRLASAVVKR